MKKLMFATALMASAAAFAAGQAGPLNAISFEGYNAGAQVGNAADVPDASGGDNGTYFYFAGDQDGSTVKAYGGENLAAPSITRPLYFASADPNAKYLELSTEGGILWRSISTVNSDTSGESPVYSLGDEVDIADTGTYLDTLVQFTPTEGDGAPEVDKDSDKLAIWLNVDSQNHTNLMVRAAVVNIDGEPTATTFTITNKTVSAGAWYRLTIKAIPDISDGDEIPGFQIRLDGDVLMSDTPTLDSEYLEVKGDSEYGEELKNGALFASLLGTDSTPTLQGIGFKGSGALDDIVWTTEDPFDVPAAAFTLTWPSGVTPVSYSIDGGTAESLTGQTSSFSIPGGVVPGSTVAFTFTNADGATKTMEVVASASVNDIDAEDAVYVWSDYLGAAVNGAYTIDDANDLDMLRKGVAANLATLGETFKQTANIDMTSADPFAGIGAYAADPTAGTPFRGTYDGQGFKIANVTMTARNYGGVFNQINGGTVRNLTVQNITVPNDASGEYGYAIVGNAGNGATLQGLVMEGSILSAAKPATHNVAGIVVRACGGSENGTLIKDCTNNASLYGDYTKLGGICALTQHKQAGGPVTFDGCVNNGALVSARTSEANAASAITGIAGIVGYTADATVLKDCVNNGTITVALANQKVGELVGSGGVESGSLTDAGGNKADATKKMLHTRSNVTGFLYATVDNGVATTVLPPLTAGATYLLEGNVAASETPVATLTAVGDTIAFDTALGYTFAGTVASSGAAGIPVASTSGTVTTYSAGYFPRTATAGQDGSAANPFEIADEDDLLALQAAVANNVGRNLAYVQTADIALTAAWGGIGVKGGKDIVSEAAYDNGAFTGVYDGGNYTISNFLMENGTDYGALFNSIYNATIKNLKLSWGSSTLCANSSASGGDTGASFVGVAKASTLQNLTTVAGTVTTVSASKDFGGIVGYLMAGSTVESCTNALNVASLKGGRKCGGIAIITQGGTGTAVLRNCKNSGTSAGGAQDGGIVGYIGVATEIDGCENTAAVQLFKFQSGSVTASGVNKGNATVRSSDASVAGLRFATVDGDVATFVADDALALNGSYKVMATGATATFAFAEAGTIAFDTALFTPTYAITAAEGLTLTDATSGTVKTYTAAAPQPAYPTYVGEDATLKSQYDTWKNTNGADSQSAFEKQFLLNVASGTTVADDALVIESITENATTGWDIVVATTVSGAALSDGSSTTYNGYLLVKAANDLAGLATATPVSYPVTAVTGGKVSITVTAGKFMKVVLTTTAPAQN